MRAQQQFRPAQTTYGYAYAPTQTTGIDINAIMNLMILMMVMGVMMNMMKGAMTAAQIS
jgi:hypothetical protein